MIWYNGFAKEEHKPLDHKEREAMYAAQNYNYR